MQRTQTGAAQKLREAGVSLGVRLLEPVKRSVHVASDRVDLRDLITAIDVVLLDELGQSPV